MEVCGTRPASRCFLCQTPPLAASTVLSMATARPPSAHGASRATRCAPGDQPRQRVGQGGQAPLPGPARRVAPVGQGQPRPHRRHLRLGQDGEQAMDRGQAAHHHQDQRLEEQAIPVDDRVPPLTGTWRRRRQRKVIDQGHQANQQGCVMYHKVVSVHKCGNFRVRDRRARESLARPVYL
jgi:hypothetical protein